MADMVQVVVSSAILGLAIFGAISIPAWLFISRLQKKGYAKTKRWEYTCKRLAP